MARRLGPSMVTLLALSCAHGGAPHSSLDGRPNTAPAVVGFTVIDASRPDPMDSTRRRTWKVFLYYGATAEGARPPGAYATDRALVAEMKRVHYYERSDSDLDGWLVRPGIVLDRAAPAASGRRALITLSPGFGVAAFNYSLLAAELVRRGLVVAVIDHPYLGLSRLDDGRILSSDDVPLFKNEDQSTWAPTIADWTRDVSMTLDRLARPPLRGLDYDLEHVIAAGHSLGGAIALDACARDRRVVACANFEGAPFGTVTGESGPSRPTLFVGSRSVKPERPQTVPDFANPIFAFLARKPGGPSAWAVSIAGGSHMSFSDAPEVMPDTITRFGGTVMSAARSFEVYAGMVTAFSAAYGRNGGGDRVFESYLASVPEARYAHTGDEKGTGTN